MEKRSQEKEKEWPREKVNKRLDRIDRAILDAFVDEEASRRWEEENELGEELRNLGFNLAFNKEEEE